MTTTIRAIETHYKGCRFRSRLEARWAVFFDALGIEWIYEPEGYVVDGKPYLPDFWLPRLELWVEIKGNLSHRDMQRLHKAVGENGLPLDVDREDRPDPVDPAGWGERVLLLGQVPEPGPTWVHFLFAYYGGHVFSVGAFFMYSGECWRIGHIGPLTRESGWPEVAGTDEDATAYRRTQLLTPVATLALSDDGDLAGAYRAARSARFEHGESGSPKSALSAPAKARRPGSSSDRLSALDLARKAAARSAPPPQSDPYRYVAPFLAYFNHDMNAVIEDVVSRADDPERAVEYIAPIIAKIDDPTQRTIWGLTLSARTKTDIDKVRLAIRERLDAFIRSGVTYVRETDGPPADPDYDDVWPTPASPAELRARQRPPA